MNVLNFPLLFVDLQNNSPPQWATAGVFEFPALGSTPQGLVYTGQAWKLPVSLTYEVTTVPAETLNPPSLVWTVGGPDGDTVITEALVGGMVAVSKTLTLAPDATSLSLAVVTGADPFTDDVTVTLTPVSAVDRAYAPNEIGRSMTAYVSAYDRSRVHVSSVYANQIARLTANFNGALNLGRAIASARWDTFGTATVCMSDAQVTERAASVLIACGYAGPAVIKCTVTLDNGEKLVQQFHIDVLWQPMYLGETYPIGPSSITVEA